MCVCVRAEEEFRRIQPLNLLENPTL